MVSLSQKLSTLSGIGPKKSAQLSALGLDTVRDALFYVPLRYEDRRTKTEIGALCDGNKSLVECMAVGTMEVRRDKGRTLFSQTFSDGTGTLRATWQNTPYLTRFFRHGGRYLLYGRVFVRGSAIRMFAPLYEIAGAKSEKLGKIVPIYPLGGGATQSLLLGVINACLPALSGGVEEILPPSLLSMANVPDIQSALYALHLPHTEEEASAALSRLKLEELFLLCTGMYMQKSSLARKKGFVFSADLTPFIQNLPFTLTDGQKNAIRDIQKDMASGKVMNRLIEGDVGSGKTAVAAAALFLAAGGGRQGVLMAPTALLANQHFATLQALLPDTEICLLTGRLTKKQRQEAEENIRSGRAQVIVGTQAVLNESLPLSGVGLVIVDEQHRFGVRQRGFLSELPQSPHVLVMSATPIPRTLSLTYYGDLDVSILPARPRGRQAVDTFCVPTTYRERIYTFIEKELQKGGRAYIICPLASGGDDALCDAESYAAALSARFPKEQVLCLHGKMKNKEETMGAFARGEARILVSTTVVEVGVDVPEATVMVVENAERFGLSQLHQLRGRVGRGQKKSYCILLSDAHGKESTARLETLRREQDGFRIAEEDLRLRGSGEMFGIRQHGQMQLLYADAVSDSSLLTLAADGARALLSEDKTLAAHPKIRQAVSALYTRFARN